VTTNRTCVLLASEDMITQSINAHLARAKRATVSVCKHLGDGRSETPAEKSLPNVRRETSLRLMFRKVQQKPKRVGNEKPGTEGQSSQVFPLYSWHTVITNQIQSPTSEGIQLVLNLGQPVTQTTIRSRRGGARTDRRCGDVDTRKLHGCSRQQGGRRRCLQESVRGDHLQRGPPIPGGPVEAREQASDNGSISRQSQQPRRDAGEDTSTSKICCSAPRVVMIVQIHITQSSANHQN